MANYTRRTETVERISYVLSVPSNAVELDKAIRHATREYCALTGMDSRNMSDDALNVSVTDDAIEIWWETQLKGEESSGSHEYYENGQWHE